MNHGGIPRDSPFQTLMYDGGFDVYTLPGNMLRGEFIMDGRRLFTLLLLLILIRSKSQPLPNPDLPPAPMKFGDHLLTLINHQVTVHTTSSSSFQGILTAVNPDFLTLSQRVNPPQAAFIPLHMIAAVTVSVPQLFSPE
jgi:hypothetical protein